MEWYYARGDEICGPVLRSELVRKRQQGEIEAETLVWCARLESWQPFAAGLQQAETAATDSRPAGACCSVCGQAKGEDELLVFGARRVCVACKPEYVQRLREGVPVQAAGTAPRGPTNSLATAGFVMAIISLPAIFCGLPGMVVMVLGLVFSVIGYRKTSEDRSLPGRGMALAGIIMSTVAGVVYIAFVVFYIGMMVLAFRESM